MKRMVILPILLLTLTACGKRTLQGTYVLASPPPTKEMIVEEIEFSADTLTMRSGRIEQTVKYEWTEDTLTIYTDFGDFSFDFELREHSILLDSLEYVER